MNKHFSSLTSGQRVEVHLLNGIIREGNFSKWVQVEGVAYIFVIQDPYIKDGEHVSGVWFMSELSIQFIYTISNKTVKIE